MTTQMTKAGTTGTGTTSRAKQYRRVLGMVAVAALLTSTAACSSSKGTPSSASKPLPGEGIGPGALPGESTAAPNPCHGEDTAKWTWPGNLPAPGAMPAGSTMATIQQRGFLIAGVDMSTWLFGYDPTHSNVPQGFDVDMAKEIAKAVFGDANPNHIKFQVVTLADPVTGEVKQLNDGNVDVVVRTTTTTCRRLKDANFSNPYYVAHQRLLMPVGPDGNPQGLGLNDLKGKGKRVCATQKSTALDTIKKTIGEDFAVAAPNALDCLIYIQQNKADAAFTDDAILRGMEAQDPKVKITTAPPFPGGDQPYGIVTQKNATDFAGFVNGVLANLLKPGANGANSRWAELFASDLHTAPDDAPKIPSDYPLG